jgi:hypothetical protein
MKQELSGANKGLSERVPFDSGQNTHCVFYFTTISHRLQTVFLEKAQDIS